jgi:ribosome-associated toxin RatA of RatAB toxin-antitoxin module
MSALVNDIASYPQFLPWCSKANVLEQNIDFMVASIEVQKGGIRQSFTTRNDLSSEGKIVMDLVDGPFKYLKGVWDFIHLKEGACKVILTLEFELKQNIAKMAFGPVFNQAANSMVDAFCERANQVYR